MQDCILSFHDSDNKNLSNIQNSYCIQTIFSRWEEVGLFRMIYSHDFYVIYLCPSRPQKRSVHRNKAMLRMSLYLPVIMRHCKSSYLLKNLPPSALCDQAFFHKSQSSSLSIFIKMIKWKCPNSMLLLTALFWQMRKHYHNHQTGKILRRYQAIPQASLLKTTSVRKLGTKRVKKPTQGQTLETGREIPKIWDRVLLC